MDPGCDRLRSTATVHNLQQRSSRKFKRLVSNTRCKPSQSEPLAHGMRGLGQEESYGSRPLKSTLFVQPQIPDEQDPEECHHRNQSEQPLVRRDPTLVQNRPRNQEHRLHVENHEQHGHNKKPHRIPPTRIALRRDPALIGLELRAERGGCRPNELCQDQCDGGKRDYQHGVNQHRNVRALHHSLTRSIVPPMSTRGLLTSQTAAPPRGWWPSQPP